MCIVLWTNKGSIESPRELGALVGGLENVIYHEHGWGVQIPEVFIWEGLQDHCLCHTDIRATLDSAGIRWVADEIPGDINLVDDLPAALPPSEDPTHG